MNVFLDACTLIYRLEGSRPFRSAVTQALAQLASEHPGMTLVVSRLSVLDCKAKPMRDGNTQLLKRYGDFFSAVQIAELSPQVVDLATELRAKTPLKTPDALQAACALMLPDSTVFVTAGQALSKVVQAAGLVVCLLTPIGSATPP